MCREHWSRSALQLAINPLRSLGNARAAKWPALRSARRGEPKPTQPAGDGPMPLSPARPAGTGASSCSTPPHWPNPGRLAELVLESATDFAILTTDLAGIITSWNGAAERTMGWSAAEAVGRDTCMIFTPEDVAEGACAREMATARSDGWAMDERWHLRKDGTRLWCSGSMTTLKDNGTGAHLGYLKIVRDRTEQHEAHAALRSSEERLRAALGIRTVGVLFWGPDFTLTAVNDAFLRMSGFSHEEAIGTSWRELTPPEFHPASLRAIEQLTMLGEATPYEKQYHRKDGSRWWGLFAPRRIEDGAVEFVLDVSDRKAAESALHDLNASLEAQVQKRTRELLAREEQLRQSQKMEAVGQLTSGIAHDFNNLLNSITGSLELLNTRVAQGRVSDLGHYVSTAQGAASRAAALTHRLLAFSRQQPLASRPTDVSRMMAGMEELIRRTMGPAIAVETVAATELWTSLVDPGQLENALLNLCINARDAMPEGGRLTIETRNECLDAQAAGERDLAPGQYVTLRVGDNGAGMTPEVVARAFDPFFTTKPVGRGTGLGLSMIYGFARQSGGQARIDSEVGQGTTVCLYLPRHHGPVEETEPPAKLSEAPRAEQGETVLVVEDEPALRLLVTELLEDLGYTVLKGVDAGTGLRVLRSDVRIDVLVTDVGLPGGTNGRQLAEAARVTRPGLKVLFITGYADDLVLNLGHLDPGMRVLAKPFAMDALARQVKDLISLHEPAGCGRRAVLHYSES
jgi:PAS domain S-box-containing protein